MYKKDSGSIDLSGKICLVTGASRGVGKGIAVQLAFYGAKCYITGRKAETLEEVVKVAKELGGTGTCIPVECDHGNDRQVKNVFERIKMETDGKLDLLVNNAYFGVDFLSQANGKKFWEMPEETWDIVNNVGLRNHYLCAMHAAKLMVERRQGLIINISSIGGLQYVFNSVYGIGKSAKDRMAIDCAVELKPYKVAFISLWPGLVSTEKVENILKSLNQTTVDHDRLQTPYFVGKTVAALLSEPQWKLMSRTGKIIIASDIACSFGIRNENGLVPYHLFQLNYILRMIGYDRIANYIPDFIRIPFWVARMAKVCKEC